MQGCFLTTLVLWPVPVTGTSDPASDKTNKLVKLTLRGIFTIPGSTLSPAASLLPSVPRVTGDVWLSGVPRWHGEAHLLLPIPAASAYCN